MNKNNKNLLPAIIIALGIIISAFIYAYAHRYEYNGGLRFDKWRNTLEETEFISK